MSLTDAQKKRLKSKIYESQGVVSVIDKTHEVHEDEDQMPAGHWVKMTYGKEGYDFMTTIIARLEPMKQLASSMRLLGYTKPLGEYITAHGFAKPWVKLLDSPDNMVHAGSVRINAYASLVIPAPDQQTKSVFDMSADEFMNHVKPRANELAKGRFKKGLSLSTPAGKGYKKNDFFHIYKDGSVKLVEVIESTGEVKFIKDIS